MSRIILTGLPSPPAGEQWCALCGMLAKGVINGEYAARFAEILADGRDEDIEVAVMLPFPLQVAAIRAVAAEAMQAGPLDLCWTHVAGLTITQQSPLSVANGMIPAGLLRRQ